MLRVTRAQATSWAACVLRPAALAPAGSKPGGSLKITRPATGRARLIHAAVVVAVPLLRSTVLSEKFTKAQQRALTWTGGWILRGTNAQTTRPASFAPPRVAWG